MPFLLPAVFLGGGFLGFQVSDGSNKLIAIGVLLIVGYMLIRGRA